MLSQVITVLKFPVAFDNTSDLGKRSKDGAAMVSYWDKVEAVEAGIDGMRQAGKKFLPGFKNEEKDDYDLRLELTKLTNIFTDICENLASKPFEEPVKISGGKDVEPPEVFKEFLDNVDGRGNSLTVFSGELFYNSILNCVNWLLIDYPDTTGKHIQTKADQKTAGVRPFWSVVLGRNVLKARSEITNGEETLTYVEILEPGVKDKLRVFQRDEGGIVEWIVYEKAEKTSTDGKEWVETERGNVSIGVIPMVPFSTGRRKGTTFEYKPAMLDAIDLQVELYQQESALKFAKVMAAYPMLAGNGVTPEKTTDGRVKPISVGPMKVLYAPPNPNGSSGNWGFVEPAATSLTFMANDIKETKQDLRELGRQPLTSQSGNLTVITTAFAAGKAKSAVAAWGMNLGNVLEIASEITLLWLNDKTFKPNVEVFTEFDDFTNDETAQQSLHSMRESGDLSQETYWDEMQGRGVLSSRFDAEREPERLLLEMPGDGTETEQL